MSFTLLLFIFVVKVLNLARYIIYYVICDDVACHIKKNMRVNFVEFFKGVVIF